MTNTKADARRELAEILDKYDTGALPEENAAANLDIVLGHVRTLLAPPAPPKYRSLKDYRLNERVEVLMTLGRPSEVRWYRGKVAQLSPSSDVCRVEVDGSLYLWRNRKTIRPA